MSKNRSKKVATEIVVKIIKINYKKIILKKIIDIATKTPYKSKKIEKK